MIINDDDDYYAILTTPCERQSHAQKHKDFVLGCSQSIRAKRRMSRRWDSRLGFFVPSRRDPHTGPCSDHSPSRQRSAILSAVFPQASSPLQC